MTAYGWMLPKSRVPNEFCGVCGFVNVGVAAVVVFVAVVVVVVVVGVVDLALVVIVGVVVVVAVLWLLVVALCLYAPGCYSCQFLVIVFFR